MSSRHASRQAAMYRGVLAAGVGGGDAALSRAARHLSAHRPWKESEIGEEGMVVWHPQHLYVWVP